MTKKIRRRLVRWFILTAIIAMWFGINHPLRFGLHCFGFTIYSGIPFPVADVVVHANGIPWFRSTKSQEVSHHELNNLVGMSRKSWPDVIIIGTGYHNLVEVDGNIAVGTGIGVESYPTPKAIQRFNELKSQGKRVAAIIHSTN
jgi:hypothetical protein